MLNMLNIIYTHKELRENESDLISFYKSIKQAHFLSPNYCIKAYELFCDKSESYQIYFIVKRINDKIVGYIPMYINGSGVLKFIYDKHTDFLYEVGCQFDYNDFKKITQGIKTNSDIKKIDLDNLPSGSKLLNYFKHFFKGECSIFSYNNHSYLIKNGVGSLLQHLSSSQRSELKRVLKKTDNYVFRVYSYPDGFPECETEYLRLKMISNGSRKRDFLEPQTIDMIKYLYAKGELEIFSKVSNDNFVSESFVLKNDNGGRMIWIDLYDDINYINLSSYIEYINHIDSAGFKFISFGRGSYDYKAKNFQPICENLYNFRYSKSKWDFFFTNYYPIKEFVKRIIKTRK